MPIHLPPISRRQFLARSLAGAAALALSPELLAADKGTDPNSWALLSDIHIAADPALVARNINMTDHLTQVSREVLALPKRPAGVFITGDCAYNSGQIADYAHVTDLLEPIRKDQMPVHLTLGNHDNRERFWEALQTGKGRQTPARGPAGRPDRAPRARIGSCSTRSRRPSRRPGLLGQEQLDWLAQRARRQPRQTRPGADPSQSRRHGNDRRPERHRSPLRHHSPAKAGQGLHLRPHALLERVARTTAASI